MESKTDRDWLAMASFAYDNEFYLKGLVQNIYRHTSKRNLHLSREPENDQLIAAFDIKGLRRPIAKAEFKKIAHHIINDSPGTRLASVGLFNHSEVETSLMDLDELARRRAKGFLSGYDIIPTIPEYETSAKILPFNQPIREGAKSARS